MIYLHATPGSPRLYGAGPSNTLDFIIMTHSYNFNLFICQSKKADKYDYFIKKMYCTTRLVRLCSGEARAKRY